MALKLPCSSDIYALYQDIQQLYEYDHSDALTRRILGPERVHSSLRASPRFM